MVERSPITETVVHEKKPSSGKEETDMHTGIQTGEQREPWRPFQLLPEDQPDLPWRKSVPGLTAFSIILEFGNSNKINETDQETKPMKLNL